MLQNFHKKGVAKVGQMAYIVDMKQKVMIFDLDHTVIDSSHRQITLPCGSLDLEHWLENCTREKIFGDELLPLAEVMQKAFRHYYVVVCTARQMGVHDFDYLAHHGLQFDEILYRAPGDNRPDGEMKHQKLDVFFRTTGFCPSDAVFFEDNLSVHEAVSVLGITCIHPEDAIHAE
jgi:hypothetical protein